MTKYDSEFDRFLLHHNRKTVLTQELQDALRCSDLETLFQLIRRSEEEGRLEPVKASGRNGNRRYPLYLKYRILREEDDSAQTLAELRTLHPRLLANGYWMRHPKECRKWKNELRQLSDYLFRHTANEVPISRKERSFAIFRQEKLLDQSAFWTLLKRLGLDEAALAFYDTPEHCLCDYICARKEHLRLLICENKDIWYNLRRMMFERNRFVLWDTPLDGVIYGQGNHVTQKNLLTEYTRFLGAAAVEYLYWGDIDREGIGIFLRAREANPGLPISLFSAAYEEMLRLAEGGDLPDSDDRRGRMPDLTAVQARLSPERFGQLQSILNRNLRLPQEIISFAYLNQHMR